MFVLNLVCLFGFGFVGFLVVIVVFFNSVPGHSREMLSLGALLRHCIVLCFDKDYFWTMRRFELEYRYLR